MRLLVPLVAVLALTGCVTLPEEGAVRSGPSQAGAPLPGTFDYNPAAPRPGDEPAGIISGFLDSLRETPLTFSVARRFLTEEAGKRWVPNKRTIVYDDGTLTTTATGHRATVSLGRSVQLDSRGSWLGDPTGGAGLHFDLRLVREDGEWRISDPPDALIVSRTHFDTRFVRYALHFFDPSGRVLVPEPVYLPAGMQAPSLLVSGLLAGPDRALRSVERTFFPAGTTLELSVTVRGGVADVGLSEEILQTDSAQLDLAMAQLAWTLRQLPGIDKMRVTVDGTPVDRTTGASARSVLGWSSYDPSLPAENGSLYALVDGDVVVDSDGETAVATTAFRRTPLRSLGVTLEATAEDTRITGVSADGRRAVSTRVLPSLGSSGKVRQAYAGTDLLRPAYDAFGHLWLVDRTRAGARVVVVDGRTRLLTAPGITGADVTSFELSRDGTRLAAVVDGEVVLVRIRRSQNGRPTQIQRARTVPLGDGSEGRAVDVAWATPDTLGVLVRPAPNISEVDLASADGAVGVSVGTRVEPLFERAGNLVTWPGLGAPLYLQDQAGRIYEVSATGHWMTASLPAGLVGPTFPG